MFWRESDSGCVFWHFAAFTAQRRHTLLAVYADVDGRRHLRLANTVSMVVPPTLRTTLGDRAFPLAMARTWNDHQGLTVAADVPPTTENLQTFFSIHISLT